MPSVRIAALLAFAALSACRGAKDARLAVDTTVAAPVTNSNLLSAPDGSYELKLPARWTGLYRVDSLSSAERGSARPGAINVVYLPRDTAVLPQTLIVVAVYDSVAWARVKTEGGPPPGDSILSQAGRVYVLGLPQSNPFLPESVDALKFDSLALNPVEKSALVHVRNL
jgi:hypothetical protein